LRDFVPFYFVQVDNPSAPLCRGLALKSQRNKIDSVVAKMHREVGSHDPVGGAGRIRQGGGAGGRNVVRVGRRPVRAERDA